MDRLESHYELINTKLDEGNHLLCEELKQMNINQNENSIEIKSQLADGSTSRRHLATRFEDLYHEIVGIEVLIRATSSQVSTINLNVNETKHLLDHTANQSIQNADKTMAQVVKNYEISTQIATKAATADIHQAEIIIQNAEATIQAIKDSTLQIQETIQKARIATETSLADILKISTTPVTTTNNESTTSELTSITEISDNNQTFYTAPETLPSTSDQHRLSTTSSSSNKSLNVKEEEPSNDDNVSSDDDNFHLLTDDENDNSNLTMSHLVSDLRSDTETAEIKTKQDEEEESEYED
jgi:hypothetical protein